MRRGAAVKLPSGACWGSREATLRRVLAVLPRLRLRRRPHAHAARAPRPPTASGLPRTDNTCRARTTPAARRDVAVFSSNAPPAGSLQALLARDELAACLRIARPAVLLAPLLARDELAACLRIAPPAERPAFGGYGRQPDSLLIHQGGMALLAGVDDGWAGAATRL